jgi:hypothetical protein
MVRRAIRMIATLALSVIVAAGVTWGAMALWFDGPQSRVLAATMAGGLGLVSLPLAVMVRPFLRGLAVALLPFGAVALWWPSIPPSITRDWAPDVARADAQSAVQRPVETDLKQGLGDWRSIEQLMSRNVSTLDLVLCPSSSRGDHRSPPSRSRTYRSISRAIDAVAPSNEGAATSCGSAELQRSIRRWRKTRPRSAPRSPTSSRSCWSPGAGERDVRAGGRLPRGQDARSVRLQLHSRHAAHPKAPYDRREATSRLVSRPTRSHTEPRRAKFVHRQPYRIGLPNPPRNRQFAAGNAML